MKLGSGHTMFGRVGAPSDKSNVAFGVAAHGFVRSIVMPNAPLNSNGAPVNAQLPS